MHWSHCAVGCAAAFALATLPSAQSAAVNAGPGDSIAPPALAPQVAGAVPGHNAVEAPAQKRTAPPSGAAKGSVTSILVYDNNTQHGFAATAAQNLSFFGTTVAGAANFNTLLTTGAWDAVAVDCPSTIPTGGWTALINYANAGGRVVMSFWDWDNSAGAGAAGLPGAFDVSVTGSDLNLVNGVTSLQDTGSSPAFLGVTMPNASWHGHWTDDGDQFNLLAGAKGLAHVGTASTPVMARGNGGKTIAAFAVDDAGDTWINDGSAVQLWENMILMVGSDGPSILVYDNNTQHSLAQTAAFEVSPGGTQVADELTFDTLLAAGPWDAVLLDVPSNAPVGGFGALINYVNGGGHVAMSFWQWNNDAALTAAFDAALLSSFSWTSPSVLTLTDSGVTDLFTGVSMPNNSWHNHWGDDGDRFTPVGDAKGLAHVGSVTQPVMVWGNAGRTICAPVFDESGDVWLGNGSAVQLWKNMLSHISEPDASCTFRTGVLGLNPNDYTCVTPPVMGGIWVASVDTTPTLGTATLTTFVTIGIGGPIVGFPIFGHELLILPPYIESTGLGVHNIPVTTNPTIVGVALPSQGARIELGVGGALFVVLTNGQDLVFGF